MRCLSGLSLSLCLCLSVCLSLSLSHSISLCLSLTQSLSLSLTHTLHYTTLHTHTHTHTQTLSLSLSVTRRSMCNVADRNYTRMLQVVSQALQPTNTTTRGKPLAMAACFKIATRPSVSLPSRLGSMRRTARARMSFQDEGRTLTVRCHAGLPFSQSFKSVEERGRGCGWGQAR